jgi:hypothetical protein
VRSTPIVIETTEPIENFGPYNMSNKGLFFMLGLEYQNGSYYTDKSIFDIHANNQYVENIVDENGQITQKYTEREIEMDVCSKYYKPEDIM